MMMSSSTSLLLMRRINKPRRSKACFVRFPSAARFTSLQNNNNNNNDNTRPIIMKLPSSQSSSSSNKNNTDAIVSDYFSYQTSKGRRNLFPLHALSDTNQVRAFSSSSSSYSSSSDTNNNTTNTNTMTFRSIERNKEIIRLGKLKQWQNILALYQKDSTEFTSTNYSTALTQLKYIILPSSLSLSSINNNNKSNKHHHHHSMMLVLQQMINDLARLLVDEGRGLFWMDGKNLAAIAHALGKLKIGTTFKGGRNTTSTSTAKILQFIATKKASNAIMSLRNTQAISSTCWAMAKLGDATSLKSFLSNTILVVGEQRQQSNATNWFIKEAQPQEIANTLWACGKLYVPVPNLIAAIDNNDAVIERLLQCGKPQELTNIAWACGRLQLPAPRFFTALDNDHRVVEKLFNNHTSTTQNVGNILWAYGRLVVVLQEQQQEQQQRTPAPKNMFAKLQTPDTVKWFTRNGQPQHLSNAAWACARSNIQAPRLFAEISTQIERITESSQNPQALANICWACGSLATLPAAGNDDDDDDEYNYNNNYYYTNNNNDNNYYYTKNIFDQMNRRSKWLLDNGTIQGISNTLWACARLNYHAPRFFQEVDQNASRLIRDGDSQNISNMTWAFGKLMMTDLNNNEKNVDVVVVVGVENNNDDDDDDDAPPPLRFFSELERQSKRLIEQQRISPQEISQMAWACATLHLHTPKLFSEIERRSDWLVENGSAQTLVNTAWACATLGFPSRKFFDALMKQDKNKKDTNIIIKMGNQHNLAMLCFSLAILDLATEYEDEFRELWTKALRFWNPDKLGPIPTTQLAQAYAFATASGVVGLQEPPPCSFVQTVQLSRSHEEISQLLSELGFSHELEVSPFPEDAEYAPQGLMAIDMACRERKIAIEFDGPSHFLKELNGSSGDSGGGTTSSGEGKVTTTTTIEEGSRKAKRRFLERTGWDVYNIRYVDWMELNGKSNDEKKKRLQELFVDILS